MKTLLQYLACWLNSLCVDAEKDNVLPLHKQFTAEPFEYSLFGWIEHILSYSQVSPSCLIQGCVLLRRIKIEYPNLQFSSMNIRRLILIATMEIAKLNEDIAYLNKDWVWISNNVFTCSTMNRMEREFLGLLHFRVLVNTEEYNSFCLMLMERFGLPLNDNIFLNPVISSATFMDLLQNLLQERKILLQTPSPIITNSKADHQPEKDRMVNTVVVVHSGAPPPPPPPPCNSSKDVMSETMPSHPLPPIPPAPFHTGVPAPSDSPPRSVGSRFLATLSSLPCMPHLRRAFRTRSREASLSHQSAHASAASAASTATAAPPVPPISQPLQLALPLIPKPT